MNPADMEDSYTESLDKLREALDEEDEDAFLELAHAVPASNWEIPAFYHPMLEMLNSFFTCSDFPEDISEYIPDSFWDDRNRVCAVIRTLLDERTNTAFNCWDILPSRVLNDREVVLTLAEYAPSQALSCAIPAELKKDKEILFAVLDGLVEVSRESYDNYPALPWDASEALGNFLNEVPVSWKSDKGFILKVIKDYTYFDDGFGLFCDWVDPKLWSDKAFVKDVLAEVWRDKRVISHLSEDMLSDEEIKELLE